MAKEMKLTIFGQPVSKANSRQAVVDRKTGRMMFIKSKAGLAYEKSAVRQIKMFINSPQGGRTWTNDLPSPITGDLVFHGKLYYKTRRPDLDESLILDCLQKAGLIENDRQIKEKHVYHFLDKENPRAEILLLLRKERKNDN